MRDEDGRVLVVEDDPALREFMSRVAGGVAEVEEVATARDGVAALEDVALHGCPALVISDIEMPRMSGLTLCADLRKLFGRSLPILLVSGAISREAAEAAGATAFIPKPFPPAFLQARICEHLSASKAS